MYFRVMLIRFVEGIESELDIALRVADSLFFESRRFPPKYFLWFSGVRPRAEPFSPHVRRGFAAIMVRR
jgi:hypothetical protein